MHAIRDYTMKKGNKRSHESTSFVSKKTLSIKILRGCSVTVETNPRDHRVCFTISTISAKGKIDRKPLTRANTSLDSKKEKITKINGT
ncbi:hypothetical protein V1477_018748 [Vespula maculifrons]|uniref:Uncharacterized protein n=1 Tax=Vespula maculifrons TaxID=7453 RepID=A0ABD2AW93_VESMC